VRSLLPVLVLAAAAPVATAQSFNLDVGDNLIIFPVPANSYAGAAGQTGVWNDVNTPYSTSLVRLDGSPSAATTSSTSPSSYNYFPSTLTGDDRNLMIDIQNLPFIGGPWTWTFSGLQNGDYALYTYAWAPENNGNKTRVDVPIASEPAQDVGGMWAGGAHVLGVTYALHHFTVSSGSFNMTVEGLANHDGSINAFQLVLQNPSGATTHCTSKPTSVPGCLPSLTGPSSITVGGGPSIAVCGPTPGGGNGMLLWNKSLAPTPPLTAFGFLCVQGPPKRAPVTFTVPGGTYPNCNGQFNFNAQALVDTAVSQAALAIGEVIYIQAWYRDTPNPGAANFSNGWGPIAIQ
jgi:hypothetical protein